MHKNFKEALNNITTFIFDFDGVLTDGKVIISDTGEPMRSMNIKDAFAIQHALKQSYRICVITGGSSPSIKTALHRLGVQDIFLKASDKLEVYKTYRDENFLKDEEILYMGDDLPDYEVIERVGAKTCPYNAVMEIKNICDYISVKNGGEGCVRDVIEQVMRLQNKWINDHTFKW